jgi:ribosomal protein S12 methylthiotransferase
MQTTSPAISIVTMGCAKNEVDSARMSDRLLHAGFRIVEDPETADAIIVNTCSFIQAATEESLAMVFDMAGLRNVEQGKAKLVVAGCMPARYGEELAQSLDEANLLVPCSKEDDIVDIMEGLFPGHALAGDVSCKAAAPSVYVKISDGCDRFCSYCTIPFIRGRYRSFEETIIEADASAAIEAGAREIVLIAQDTGRWGLDFDQPSSLACLMEGLAERHPDTWFRVMYLQPEGVTDELLHVMATHENICSYLDIPFQHADQRILAAMNRTGSRSAYEALIAHVRLMVPEIALRTTVIAGFPGETDDEFEELCDFLEVADFDYVGVFPYSREDGTRAADLPGQIDEDVKMERTQRIRDLADALSGVRVAGRIGSQIDVLVLGEEEDGQLVGRGRCQAPDVDGVVYLDSGSIGEIKRVSITDTLLYEMEGEQV